MQTNPSTDLLAANSAQSILRAVDRAEFARAFWDHCARESSWHPHAALAANAVALRLTQIFPDDINDITHPYWQLLDRLHTLLIGYQPELGKAGTRYLDDLAEKLTAMVAGDWASAAAAVAGLCTQEQTRQQRIEQRLIDSADGQLRSQRARQQATQLLNRCMAGKKVAAHIVAWLQGEWFGELQWCLLHHGDSGSAWQRRADITLALIASLQPPNEDNGGRQALYAEVPRVSAELRELLSERAVSVAAMEEVLGRIEQQHLLLLKGQILNPPAFKLLAADTAWYADISLSREMRTRIETVQRGHWFVLREDDGERRVKLILKQDEAGQLLFVNQLGIKALQVSVEEFAYRLAAEMAVPLPQLSGGRQALLATLALFAEHQRKAAAHQHSAEQARREEEAALEQRRAEVRERIEQEARQRAMARAKAVAEAQALAAAEAQAAALAAAQAAAAEQEARERESARRREVVGQQIVDDSQRQRQARQQAMMLAIGHWLELHDEKGHLQRLKLAVKLQTSGKLIFVDREGIRRAEFSHEQLVNGLLEGSARIPAQGPQFEDTLARVVNGLRRTSNRIATGSNNNDDG